MLLSEEILSLLRADVEGRLKVVNTGVRIFEREVTWVRVRIRIRVRVKVTVTVWVRVGIGGQHRRAGL